MKSEISVVGKRQKVLQDLQGIYLVIEEITFEQEADPGLLEYQLQEDLKRSLRIAGIPVLSAEEWIETPGTPYLYVNVTVAEVAHDHVAAYSITVELHQNVSLSEGPMRHHVFIHVGYRSRQYLLDRRIGRRYPQVSRYLSRILRGRFLHSQPRLILASPRRGCSFAGPQRHVLSRPPFFPTSPKDVKLLSKLPVFISFPQGPSLRGERCRLFFIKGMRKPTSC